MKRGENSIVRVQRWIETQPPGSKFTARDVGKVLDLMPYSVGCTLKWQENIVKNGRTGSHDAYVQVWEKV